MNVFRSEVQFQKMINWIAKIATLIVSAPATIAVAKKAYPDVSGLVQIVVIGACVVLVEFSFLFFWIKLETTRANASKDEQLQGGYLFGAWSMYCVLLYAGILHGEGWMTLLFRASMGLLLLIASRDRLILTKAKVEEMIANGDYRNRRLLSAQTKVDEQVAMKRIQKDKKLRLGLIDKDPSGIISKQAELKEFAALAKEEQSIPKIRKQYKRNSNMMENDFYTIEQIDDQFQVACKRCGFSMLKEDRITAAMSGNSHQRKHSRNGHKQIKLIAIEK